MSENKKVMMARSDHVLARARLLVAALREGGQDLDHLNSEGRGLTSLALVMIAAAGVGTSKEEFLSAAGWCWDVGRGEDEDEDEDGGHEGEGAQPPVVAAP